ncbi:glycoside hydrolase family 5 protein [Candidatus Bathyarchaeota archaeon]|nr:glycoside hydrolase family 5 protein [Candidatus Bathyarchaeota archaeon]
MRKTYVFEQNRRLGRGVNVLGYDPIWKSFSRARMKSKHFVLIKQAGFSSVRIPLHPFRDDGIDEKNKLRDEWLKVLDWAVDQALSNGLMVVLDFHEFVAMGKDPLGNKDRFLSTWKQMAERYRNSPDNVIFEILNEPHEELTPELWNQFYHEALSIIRETNPERTVIIGPGNWNDIYYLDYLKLPKDDRNIIVTVHYYRPMDFTHQGAIWAGRGNKVGVKWKGTMEEEQVIVKDFEKAQAWSERIERPLFLGEFGVYDKADMASRVRYLSFVARLAEKMGWSWAYWQFDGDFIVYDMNSDKWVEPILNALIPPEERLSE